MSKKTNELLHLFSKLLRSPQFVMAMHMEMISARLHNRNKRNGAQGLLVELGKQDGLTNSEISELLDIKPSSVTAQVKNLEEEGFVARCQDENDKRVSRVFLTENGKKVNEQRTDLKDNIGSEIFDCLSDEEIETLAVLLEKLVDINGGETYDLLECDPFGGLRGGFYGRNFDFKEMRQAAEEMRRARNEMRHQIRNQALFGQDFKVMKDQLKENFNHRFDGDHNPFRFKDGMKERRKKNDGELHKPWNFGQHPQKQKPEKKEDENWNDF